jgi:hypothetical protein
MRISTPNIWFGIAGATECYVNDALIGAFTYFTHAAALLGPKATFAAHLMHSAWYLRLRLWRLAEGFSRSISIYGRGLKERWWDLVRA